MTCGWDVEENLDKAESMIREAAERGANVVLLQELFATPYFCKDWKPEHFSLAITVDDPPVKRMAALAGELGVAILGGFFERARTSYYNSLMALDADGSLLGVYRKSHIPEGPPGCHEKYYFSPGDTGFTVWPTRFGTVGAGVCWDQYFPEAARVMVLRGAEVLLYSTAAPPTALGTDGRTHWHRVMQGHAAANMVPVVASNRIGTEVGDAGPITYFGSSFIAGPHGEVLAEAPMQDQAVITAELDLDAIRALRDGWGLFRDRRPDLYGPILTRDGG